MLHTMQILKKSFHSSRFWKSTHLLSYFMKPKMSVGDSSRGKADHLSVTSSNSRQDITVPAEIAEIKDISSTVKLLGVRVQDPKFVFKAGQWVDMFIPGVETVGGFSMCSAPSLLSSDRKMDLAIKYSKHPPAFWVHSKCKIGDEVLLRAGGDFFYDPLTPQDRRDLLLLAGGVGINPLYSILLHFLSLQRTTTRTGNHFTTTTDTRRQEPRSRKASMLFCGRNEEELLFSEQLKHLSQIDDNIRLQLHCTREKPQRDSSTKFGRIQEEDVVKAADKLDQSQTKVFICGPSSFIGAMESHCRSAGITQEHIHFEQWW